MDDVVRLSYDVPGDDFTRAGEASSSIKKNLKMLGVNPDIVRRAAVAMYEGEINMVIHANGGKINVEVTPNKINMVLADHGPGIPDIDLAMKEGYTTAPDDVRSLGFGAGMGLPNMKKYSDDMYIKTKVGEGTTVYMTIYIQ